MKKLFKWLIGLIVTLVLLLVVAVFLLPVFFDPNDHKPEIQDKIEQQIGRSVQLNGDIGWSVFPWIAIELNDVVIDNDPGFTGDYLADIGTLSARVKLLPLLKKNIQVDTVTLKSPDINLQVAASGRDNWQSILDHLASENVEPDSTESAAEINIQGIEVSNGTLNYRDVAAATTLTLQNLDFSSTAISADSPSDMSISADLSLAEQDLKATVQSDFSLSNLLTSQALLIDINSLSLDGDMAQVPLSVVAKQAGRLDTGSDQLSFPEVELNYANMQITTNIKGQQISQQAQYSGSMHLASFQLDELINALGSTLDNKANNQLSGQMDWQLQGSRLLLKNLTARLDDSQLSGQVTVNNLEQLAGNFDLTLDKLNLDDYLPQSEDTASTSQSEDAATDFGHLNGQVTVGQLTAMGTELDNIKLNLKTNGRELSLRPLTADFYQGLLTTELTLSPDKVSKKLVLSHAMKDIQAAPLLKDLMGSDYLSGLGSFEADMSVDEPFAENPIKTANGRLSYHLGDGDINGIDVFQIMQKALSLLNKTEAATANKALKTEFGSMDVVADVVNGVLKTSQLSLKSPYFNLSGDVEIDLSAQTINGTIKPMLTNLPEGVLDQRFEKLLNQRIPVSLSGSMLSPKIGIDIKQMIIDSQKDKIDAKKEELKKDLFDSILGKKDKDKKQDTDKQTAENDDKGGNQSTEQPDAEQTETDKNNPENSHQDDSESEEDSKDQLKRDLLEGLFNKATKKKTEPEAEPEADPEPQS